MKLNGTNQDTGGAMAFLDDGEIAVLQSACMTVELSSGETLFRTGEPAALIYFLISGRLAVQKRTGFAEKLQVVALLDPGAPVGEGAAVPGQVRGATVVAIEACRLFSLERGALELLRESNPPIAWKIILRLMQVAHLRLQKSSERLARIM